MKNTQLDSREFTPLYWPYDVIASELSDTPRQVAGSLNTFVTLGGKIRKRPGTSDLGLGASLPVNREPARTYYYETIDGQHAWLISSMRKTGVFVGGEYELYYKKLDTVSTWVSFGSLRGMNNSTAPHEVVIQRGVAYIRGTPDATTGEVYCTTQFSGDGGTPVIRVWGLPSPTIPCRMSGRTALLVGDISDVALALNINTAYSPAVATPFTVQIDDERIRVTSIGGGTNWTITRGYDGTTATNHTDGAFVVYHDWAVSDHRVDVVNTWKYTYTWVSPTGQVSNRAPLETNPDLMSSATFPFFDQVPKMTVQGHADTTNITKINVYRTQDGGGTFYFVGEVTNTGAGNITFEDKYLETGPSYGTTNDPIPDDLLDQGQIAPSLTSNTVPPPVSPPEVIGTDVPEGSSPLASYAGRIWFAIGNYLYFSGLEEIREGVPEECFPAGATGNFFKYQYPIVTIAAGENALYVMTTQHTYKVSGQDRQTFNTKPLLHNIGGYSKTSVTRVGDRVAFMTHDRRVGMIDARDQFVIVSEPLGDSWNFSGSFSAQFHFEYWGDRDRDLLLVFLYLPDTELSRLYVLDLALSRRTERQFWNAPWDITATCSLVCKLSTLSTQRYILLGTPSGYRTLDIIADTTTDLGAGIDWMLRSGLSSVPEGNHVNALRAPGLTGPLTRARLERTRYSNDVWPQVSFSLDDFWTDPVPAVELHIPTSREPSKWYETLYADVDNVAARAGIELAVYESVTPIEFHNIALTWLPDSGAME